jgi:hypothetical protein
LTFSNELFSREVSFHLARKEQNDVSFLYADETRIGSP